MRKAIETKTEFQTIVVLSHADTGTEYASGELNAVLDDDAVQGILYGTGDGHQCDECAEDGCKYGDSITGLIGSVYNVRVDAQKAIKSTKTALNTPKELFERIDDMPEYAEDSVEAFVADLVFEHRTSHDTHLYSALVSNGFAEELCLGDFI